MHCISEIAVGIPSHMSYGTHSQAGTLQQTTGGCTQMQYSAHRLLDFATVYDKHHVINGDAGLSDIGGDHYLPHSWRWAIKNLCIVKVVP
jgi:hypothetical protein